MKHLTARPSYPHSPKHLTTRAKMSPVKKTRTYYQTKAFPHSRKHVSDQYILISPARQSYSDSNKHFTAIPNYSHSRKHLTARPSYPSYPHSRKHLTTRPSYPRYPPLKETPYYQTKLSKLSPLKETPYYQTKLSKASPLKEKPYYQTKLSKVSPLKKTRTYYQTKAIPTQGNTYLTNISSSHLPDRAIPTQGNAFILPDKASLLQRNCRISSLGTARDTTGLFCGCWWKRSVGLYVPVRHILCVCGF